MAIAEPVAAPTETVVVAIPPETSPRPLAAARARASQGAVPVVLFAAVAAVAATIWSAHTNSLLLYGDARAHLDVARRVTDGLRTGPAQLGSVWLPLPHVLMAPLAYFRPLWHSGAAGAIVGGCCFVYAVARVWAVVDELTGSRAGAWCAALAMVGNLNLLYLQSTALTEPVLLAFIAGTAFHLARWMRTLAARDLGWAAVLTAGATLTRYEGWALLAGALVAVVAWSRVADRRRKSGEASFVLYSAVAVYGIVLWLLYNLIIFHDPLYFVHSIYSSQAINGGQAKFGRLAAEHHVLASILVYGWAVVGVVGPLMLVVAAVGLVVLLTRRSHERPATWPRERALGRPQRRTLVVLGVLFVPVIFEVVSLYLGQATILVPQRAPRGMWNDRYAIVVLPFVAVAIGCAVAVRRRLVPLAVGAIVAATVLMGLGTPLTIADGRTGTSSAALGHKEVAASFLHTHYRGGEVLADDAYSAPFIFASDLDLKSFVTVGAHGYWQAALLSPSTSVAWVVAVPTDAVSKDMAAHPDRFRNFHRVVTDGLVTLYQKTPA